MRIFFLLLIFKLIGTVVFAQNTDSIKISCTRTFLVTDKSITVSLHIRKESFTGFAGIYETIPEGFTFDKINCGNAIHKTEKNKLRIVWDDIPSDTIIEISYRIRINKSVSDTFSLLNGSFSAEISEADPVVFQNGKVNYQKTPVQEIIVAENKTTVPKTEKPNEMHPLSNNTETYFCIQVAATGKNVTNNYLKKHFGFEGEFESHFEENIYRITVGKFKSFTEAETALNEYKTKYFKDCFLSAYQNSHKISISEAKRILE